jgi:uncharacterized membrane protein
VPFFLKPPAAVVGLYRRVISSLWFTPSLYVLGSVLLVTLVIEGGQYLSASALQLFPAADSVTVRGALQLLASSTLTVATVTFSILMVVMTMTASTFSPRAVSGFMRDRVDQNTLGVFLGGFAFGAGGILLLQPEPAYYDPRLLGLVLLTTVIGAYLVLCALVYFIHHTATALQISNLIVHLYRDADVALTRFLMHSESEMKQSTVAMDLPSELAGEVEARAAGYIQVLDRQHIFRLAVAHNLLVRVIRHTGDFATRGSALCEVWPAARLTPEVADGFRAAYAVGARRTSERDPLLGMDLLAEIGVRALSPGINDPSTAVNCLDFIGDLLVRLAVHELPRQEMRDEEGRLRVLVAGPEFRDFLERSLLGIAGAGAGHARVVLSLLRLLRDVASVTKDRARCSTIETTAKAIADLALQKLAFEREREQIREAIEKLEVACAEPFG